MAEPVRIVAVLGYSGRRQDGLHAVCARRLSHAEKLAAGAHAVLLSGEAAPMRAAWQGPEVPLLADGTARNTAENAAGIAAYARELGAGEVVVVTSWWHALRARALVRVALRGSGIAVLTSSPHGRPGLRLGLRELACLAAVPYQLLRARASTIRRHERDGSADRGLTECVASSQLGWSAWQRRALRRRSPRS